MTYRDNAKHFWKSETQRSNVKVSTWTNICKNAVLEPQLNSNMPGSKYFGGPVCDLGILSQPAGGGIPSTVQRRVPSSFRWYIVLLKTFRAKIISIVAGNTHTGFPIGLGALTHSWPPGIVKWSWEYNLALPFYTSTHLCTRNTIFSVYQNENHLIAFDSRMWWVDISSMILTELIKFLVSNVKVAT